MEIGEVGTARLRLALGKHAQRYARESTCHLCTHQAAIDGSQLMEGLAIQRIVEEIHLPIAADAEFHGSLAQARHALHHIVYALELAAQSHLLAGDEEVEMTVIDLINGKSCLHIALGFHLGLQGHTGTLLSASHEGWLIVLCQCAVRIEAHKELFFCRHRIIAKIIALYRILQLHPFIRASGWRIILVGIQMLLQRHGWQSIRLDQGIDRHSAIHHRPFAFLPLHWSEISFTTQVMIRAAIIAISQEHHPPGAIRSLDQVAMARALYLHALSQAATVGKDRVMRIALVWSHYVLASGDGESVSQLRAALGDEEVIISILLIDMWTFWIASAITLPQLLALGELLARLRVYLAKPDGIARIAHHIALAILKIERWVDALLLEPDGFAPRSFRVSGSYHEVAAIAHIGGYHIIDALVITDGWRIDA